MLDFLLDNIATIIVCIILVALIFLALFRLYRDRKNGKSPCGHNCNECPHGDFCKSKSDKNYSEHKK